MKERFFKISNITAKISLVFLGLFLFYVLVLSVIKNIDISATTLALEYLKVLIWPSVAFTLIFIFRNNFSGLIDRLAEFSLPGGVSGKINPQAQQQGIVPEDSIDQDENFNELLTEKESQITAVQITNTELQQKLSTAEIELDLERIYNAIFASQIDLLLKMANFENVEFAYVDDHFNKAQQASYGALNSWTTAQYIQFLISNALIEYPVGTSVLTITLKGRVFLNYLSVRNYKKYGL